MIMIFMDLWTFQCFGHLANSRLTIKGYIVEQYINEPRQEKTCLRGLRPE